MRKKFKITKPYFDQQTGQDLSDSRIVDVALKQLNKMLPHWESMGYTVEEIKTESKSSEDGESRTTTRSKRATKA